MPRLIVNADELGLSPSTSAAIEACHRFGTVSSTTVIVNLGDFDGAVAVARRNPRLGTGAHLNLTDGRPVAPAARVPTLVGADAAFRSRPELLRRLALGRVSADDVRREWEAQLARLDAAGVVLTHLDTHQHVHMVPALAAVLCEIATRRKLPVRNLRERFVVASPRGRREYFVQPAYLKRRLRAALLAGGTDGVPRPDALVSLPGVVRPRGVAPALAHYLAILDALPAAGVTELMVHPGVADATLDAFCRHGHAEAAEREAEYRILLDPRFRAALAARDVRLETYATLRDGAASDDQRSVLLLTYACSVGGCENHLLHLARGLVGRGWRVRLAYFRELAEHARSLVADFDAAGVELHELGGVPWWHPRGARRLRELLATTRPALLHTHLPGPDLVGALVARAPVRRIVSVHNQREARRVEYPRRLLRRVWSSADALIAISHGLRAYLEEDVGVPPGTVHVVPYGLPPAAHDGRRWLRAGLGLAADVPLVVTIGRLVAQKGHAHLVDAMPAVLAAVPECHAVIIGHRQDDTHADAVAERIAARGLARRVHLLGYRDVGADALAEADVFAFPSLWEGFGLAVIEAMRAGLPVVASDIGPLRDVVVEGETGWLVPPGDPAALAAALVRVLTMDDRGRGLGRRGQRRVATHFGADAVVERTIALYDEVLGAAPARAARARA